MIGRYAPSPSGDLHVGNLRTALLAWLAAHSSGSDLLLRIDDLDPATSTAHEHSQRRDLAAIGITFGRPETRQSDQVEAYDDAIERLRGEGLLYTCYCSRREIREAIVAPHGHLPDGAYPGTCRDLTATERSRRERERPGALRVRAELADVAFVDAVHGPTRAVVDDFVVRRNDGLPAYNLTTVVDDAHMGVEQVVRGDDLLASTTRHIWLAERLGLPRVEHAHVPLILNDEGDRLAKRHGAVTLADLARRGWEPTAVRAELLASTGFAADATTDLADLVPGFAFDRLPREPAMWRELPDRSQKNASDTE